MFVSGQASPHEQSYVTAVKDIKSMLTAVFGALYSLVGISLSHTQYWQDKKLLMVWLRFLK